MKKIGGWRGDKVRKWLTGRGVGKIFRLFFFFPSEEKKEKENTLERKQIRRKTSLVLW